MNHKDIVQIINSLEIAPLTKNNFNDFLKNAEELFTPEGAKFQKYFSPGANCNSISVYDFINGKPEWREWNIQGQRELVLGKMEHNSIIVNSWLKVYFDNDIGSWGYSPNRLPLKFAFDPKKALYIADQQDNGTPEDPWESLYIKLQ